MLETPAAFGGRAAARTVAALSPRSGRRRRRPGLPHPHAVRTMYGMEARALERVELRAPAGRKAKWIRAAERAGVSLSDWARRRLDEVADAEIGSDEPAPPSAGEIAGALEVEGALKGSGLGARVRAARKTPWTVE